MRDGCATMLILVVLVLVVLAVFAHISQETVYACERKGSVIFVKYKQLMGDRGLVLGKTEDGREVAVARIGLGKCERLP